MGNHQIFLSSIYGEAGNLIGTLVSKVFEKLIESPKFRFYVEKWLLVLGYSAKAFQSINRFISFAAIISFIPIGCYFYIFSLYPIIPQSIGGGQTYQCYIICKLRKNTCELSKY